MAVWKIVLIVVLVVLAALFIALLIIGNKMRKRQEEQQAQIDAAKQVMSMLIIDKKIMKMSEAGLPKIVMDQTPKYMRRTKLPIVKAKIGPKVMTLIADNKVFDELPVKAEVKAEVSGIYIVGLKSVRGGKAAATCAKFAQVEFSSNSPSLKMLLRCFVTTLLSTSKSCEIAFCVSHTSPF